MQKTLKFIFIILLTTLVLLGIYIGANWRDIKNFQPMGSATFSKFMCSCMFVEGRSEEQCLIWSRVVIPQQSYSVNKNEKSVTSSALWYTSTARYRNDRFGCTLE